MAFCFSTCFVAACILRKCERYSSSYLFQWKGLLAAGPICALLAAFDDLRYALQSIQSRRGCSCDGTLLSPRSLCNSRAALSLMADS
eukprot:4391405-Pleurochrysis_carterae.AAC.1